MVSKGEVIEDNFKNQLIDALAVRFKTSIPTIKRWLEGICEPHPMIKQAVLKSLINDHERIVAELRTELKIQDDANEILARQNAELRAEVESLKTTVANNRLDHEWPIVKQLSETKETIATQKRVIEKLKIIDRDFAWHFEDCTIIDADEDPQSCNCGLEKVRAEIEAIEKGES